MAESTLSLSRNEFRQRIGDHLGYGAGEIAGDTAWTAKQLRDIDYCVDDGLRMFYQPAIDGQSGAAYEWSFLKPTGTFTIASGEETLTLPDDFGGFTGTLAVMTSGASYRKLQQTNEARIDQMYADQTDASGPPQMFAVRPIKGTTLTKGQRYELYVYPEADADYELRGAYNVAPDAITADRPYPYGGAAHAGTIMAAMIAAAERSLGDKMETHNAHFQRQLLASIAKDRSLKPQTLGRNIDRSDDIGSDRLMELETITLGGLTPS